MKKIAFIYQAPHPSHAGFAKSINAKFIHYNPHNFFSFLVPIQSLFRSYLIKKYDVLFLESGACLPLASYTKMVKKNIKIVLLVMDPLFYNLFSIKRNFLFFLIKKYVDGIIVVSKYMKQLVKKSFDCPIRVAYPYALKTYEDIKPRLNNKNILFVGHARRTKGYRKLIESFKLLKKRDRDWSLYLVGECSKDIKEMSDGLYIKGKVQKMDPFFSKCSLYVHPADFDPCPVSVWEAMSAGLIPIVTKNMGNAEILKENGLGNLILEDNQPHTIVNKIEEIFNSPKKMAISSLCRRIALDFTKEKRTKLFKIEFLKLLEGI